MINPNKKDITIHNHTTENRKDTYYSTMISNCNWSSSKVVMFSTNGQSENTKHTIRIPLLAIAEGGKTYLSPKEWEESTDKQNYWTVKTNDKIVDTFGDMVVVISCNDNRFGNESGQHLKVTCG